MYSIQESEKETGAIIKLQKCLIIFFQKKIVFTFGKKKKTRKTQKKICNIWVGIKNEQWFRRIEARRAQEQTSVASLPPPSL